MFAAFSIPNKSNRGRHPGSARVSGDVIGGSDDGSDVEQAGFTL